MPNSTAGATPNPRQPPFCLSVVTKTGIRVVLGETWYHHHILQRHPEFRHYPDALKAINEALEISDPQPGDEDRSIYEADASQLKTHFKKAKKVTLRVVVEPESDGKSGFVVTAYLRVR